MTEFVGLGAGSEFSAEVAPAAASGGNAFRRGLGGTQFPPVSLGLGAVVLVECLILVAWPSPLLLVGVMVSLPITDPFGVGQIGGQ